MTDYEKWVNRIILETKAEAEYDKVCKEADCKLNLARVAGENVGRIFVETEERKLQAKSDKDFMSRK